MLYFFIYLDTSVGRNVIQAIFSSECLSEMFSCTSADPQNCSWEKLYESCPQVLHIMWISHVGHLCWTKRRNRTATTPPPPPPPPPPSRFKEQAPSANESNRSLKVFGRTSGLARNWPLFFSQTGRITASLVTGWAQQLCSCKSRYGQE